MTKEYGKEARGYKVFMKNKNERKNGMSYRLIMKHVEFSNRNCDEKKL